MNLLRLLYLRWRVRFLTAQWEHKVQISYTYGEEAKELTVQIAKLHREIFQRQPVREITQ
jgi:hypothetical protein